MVFRPARRRPRVMASPAPSADTGSGWIASASPPSATMRPATWRVSVRAQIEVLAMPALTANPCRVSAPHTHLHQRGLAAEQMGAAGDIQEQTMRRIERHQRREAVAPVGDVAQASARRPPHRHRTPSPAERWRGHWRAAGRSTGRGAPRRRRARKSAARCFAWRRRCDGSSPGAALPLRADA